MQSSASTRSGSNLPFSQRAQRHWREGIVATNLAIALYIAVAPHVDFTLAGMAIALAAGVAAGIVWVLARSILSSGDEGSTDTWIIDRSDPAPARQSRPSLGAQAVPLRESHPIVKSALRAAPTPANIPLPNRKSPAPAQPLELRRSSVPPAPLPLGEPKRVSPAPRASQPGRMEEIVRRPSVPPIAGRRSSLPPPPPLHVVTANLANAPNLANGASVLHPALLTNLHVLRTELFMLAAQECFVIGICSDAARKALKSEFAAQLAVALAQPGQARVLLVEADAATPSIERSLTVEIPRAVSFSQQLLRRASEADRTWAVLRIAPGVDVLAEGRMRTPGMLYAPAFSNAISDLRRHYDVIVADGPVIGVGDGARAFEAVTDGVAFLTSGESSAREPRERAFMQFHTKRLFKLLAAAS